MDTQSGHIYTYEEMKALKALFSRSVEVESLAGRLKPMTLDPTAQQMGRTPPRVGRNETCPCGSGKKFKRCCLFVQTNQA